jgi:hypothetical protein
MFVTPYSCSARRSLTGSNFPAMVPVVTPIASGARVPCQRPWPHAGDDGQKNSSPGRMPVPYSAASITTTMARCVWRTASGSSRVVPDVYWNIARSSGALCQAYVAGSAPSVVSHAWSEITTSRPSMLRAVAAFSSFVMRSRGAQSSTRRFTPSGPNSVKSGTAMAPRLIAPNSVA